MTYLACDYYTPTLIDGPDAATTYFDRRTASLKPYGGCGTTLWFGLVAEVGQPDDSVDIDRMALRVDVDVEADRAALRWLYDGTYAIELEPDVPLTVLESSDRGLVTIPAELARVSVDTARRAVTEYVRTGQRPTGVEWAA